MRVRASLRTFVGALCAVTVAGAIFPPSTAARSLVASRFTTDAEAWQIQVDGSGPAPYAPADGHPPGSIYTLVEPPHASPYEVIFIAPAKFLGNRKAAYRGSLEFDQYHDVFVDPIGNVYLHGGGIVLRHAFDANKDPEVWKHIHIPLSKNGWKKSPYVDDATAADMKAALKNITAIAIDFGSPPEEDFERDYHLDTVTLVSGP